MHEAGLRQLFHPVVADWFAARFDAPTEPQHRGWPAIAAGQHTLIAAPTGSGKTLSAFLVCLDRLLRRDLAGELAEETSVLYVSPLKALGNDIERNLQIPLEEIRRRCLETGLRPPEIRVRVRTGDTPASERQALLRRPPHLLVTTPESLYLMLTAEKSRALLRRVETVIVDEIHALARDKRGSHLTLSLARLDALCDRPATRIGLSATQKPLDEIARFLVGTPQVDRHGRAACAVIDAGHARQLDLGIDVPQCDLESVCSLECWEEIYAGLERQIAAHRSTLIFVNTRRLAERIAHRLRERLGDEAVASHHGSLAKELRHSAEERLKAGSLQAIVATASLEMGIDVGHIDLVCQIGSPRSIATFLQRIGRSGHSLGTVPKGRLFPLTRDELLECHALLWAVRDGQLDAVEIPDCPLDILAQQVVAAVACEEWQEAELFQLVRNAWPFRNLRREDFAAVVKCLSEGTAPGVRKGRQLHRDAIQGRLRARRGARIAALTSGGAIPETGQYRVLAEPDQTYVGQLDEDFAIESQAGDIFLLGNTSWQILRVGQGEVLVRDAHGAPPSVPFWFGEAPGRTAELSAYVSRLREQIAARLAAPTDREVAPAALSWLGQATGVDGWGAEQAVRYVAAEQAALGLVPTDRRIVFERFFDESGGMQLVIHAPLGARINRAWGLALRKRFCRSFDFELQASATDDGIVLSLGPQHSFPVESLFGMLTSGNARHLLEQALLAVPMFQVRWRWNVTRALAVLRQRGGQRVAPFLQRFQSDDLLAVVFPQTVGCLEKHAGDVPIPAHPWVRQTMHDCLHEAMDLDRWLRLLAGVEQGQVQLIARETREPSPFSHELLNANPYAFLDGAPLEERRTRAVSTRRGLVASELSELGRLDPDAIRSVAEEAAPWVRSADELHDALWSMVVMGESEADPAWRAWFAELTAAGRAARVVGGGRSSYWIAAERWPVVRAVWPAADAEPRPRLPAELEVSWESAAAVVELLRGRLAHSGPQTVAELQPLLGLRRSQLAAGLEALEGEGTALRGRFRGLATEQDEWCDRRLLARIHRRTMDGLRRSVQPVELEAYYRFLVRHHGLLSAEGLLSAGEWGGANGVREVVQLLAGLELPAGAWERHVLPVRIRDYEPAWLDELFLAGEAVWGRLGSDRGKGPAQLHRGVPLALLLREDLPWLVAPGELPAATACGSAATLVFELLQARGALFPQELLASCGLLPTQLDAALSELAAAGLVTCDGFGPLRTWTEPQRRGGRRATPARAGRWSPFPLVPAGMVAKDRVERWAWQLLRRWGILFRDLMVREPAAPTWTELVASLRTLERRGEIRGGRFIAGVGGEQYALPLAVAAVRNVREPDPAEPWIAISTADPLNLTGLVGPRIPGRHTGALVLWQGRVVASRQSGKTRVHEQCDAQTTADMTRALHRARRPTVALHESSR